MKFEWKDEVGDGGIECICGKYRVFCGLKVFIIFMIILIFFFKLVYFGMF